jgi:hypothetical protein
MLCVRVPTSPQARQGGVHPGRAYAVISHRRFPGPRTVTTIELDGGDGIAGKTLVVVVGIGSRPATGWLESSSIGERACPSTPPARPRAPGRTEHWEAAARQAAAVASAMRGVDIRQAPLPELLEQPARPPHPAMISTQTDASRC